MKKAISIISACLVLVSCLSSPLCVSALDYNSSSNKELDEKTIAELTDWGVDADLLYAALSATNTRDTSYIEYVIGFYTTQAFVLDHTTAHMTFNTYYSNNLSPYIYQNTNLLCSTAYINRNLGASIINEGVTNYGYNYISNYESEILYLGSTDWVVAGLFRKTGNGTVTLGQNPFTLANPITSFYLKPDTNGGSNINCANPSYATARLGDVYEDDIVDVSDAVAVYQTSTSSSKKRRLAADVNFDHQYNADDANLILSYILGNIESFCDASKDSFTNNTNAAGGEVSI